MGNGIFEKYLPESLFQEHNRFELRIGGTVYEVSTHFDPSGRQSVLDQFRDLLLKACSGISHIGQQDPDTGTISSPLQCPVVRKGE